MDVANPGKTLENKTLSVSEDIQWIREFLDGEASSFTKLVNKYRRQVYAVAYRFTRNAEEAGDLTQETFIKAYKGLASFRQESSFKTWLLRITTNLSINYTKSGRISKDSGEEPDEFRTGANGQALEGLLFDERKQELHKAIAKLPPKQKQALMLKTFEEMTCDQVAQVMNCSPGTVKANVFNARKKLKTILNPGG